MILCFTGTGNSKYIALALADYLKDEAVSLNDIIKFKKKAEFTSEKPFVIVAPIYAWRYPRAVDEIIKNGSFHGTKKIYFIATMGSQTGKCDMFCKEHAKVAGLTYMGFRGIVMPDNFVSFSVMAPKEKTDRMVSDALPVVKEIADAIINNRMIYKTDKTPFAGILSGVVNNMFTKHMCDAKRYVVSDACTQCGLCVKKCPLNNVTMKEGEKPSFGSRCMNCYACIQYCPKQAINIPNKTEKHGRYTCKEYLPGNEN